MLTLTEDEERVLEKAAAIEYARRSFYFYCQIMNPEIYADDRWHLAELCNVWQAFCEDRLLKPDGTPYKKIIVNEPPRHGKTITIKNGATWLLGKTPDIPLMTFSYNAILSGRLARGVRDQIDTIPADPYKAIYHDIFPGSKIKWGDSAYQMWALEGRHFSFLASSPDATATGFGAMMGIIDDLIKSPREAYNAEVLDNQWRWYTDTYLSRIEEGGKTAIIQTRWSPGDLPGRLIKEEPDDWYVLARPAFDGENMLCESILSRASYEDRKRLTSPDIFEANYNQRPYLLEGQLYSMPFKVWQILPQNEDGTTQIKTVGAYIDTADEGADYLCAIIYGVYQNSAYVYDVIYTKAPMEITEEKTALALINNGCTHATIESNNGGRGFARNVERIMREKMGYTRCRVDWFHQSENKQARILSNATSVMNSVIMPHDWQARWPEFHRAVTTHQRVGKNAYDDAPDALTGIIEKGLTKRGLVIV